MKDLTRFVSADAIDKQVFSLWRTDIFRQSHQDPDGYVGRIVADYAALPRVFCEPSAAPLERAHFLAWMGVTPHRRSYENAAISDLYYFHEYCHQATMPYQHAAVFEPFCHKIWDNERAVSLESEVYVYFELPDLRKSTFGFEIWADRFLNDPEWVALFKRDRAEFVRRIDAERQRAMLKPKSGDKSEELIAKYASLNQAWADIWKRRYVEVENAMADFVERATTDRADALERHIAFMLRQQGDALTPFEPEAQAFAVEIEKIYSA